MQFRQKQNITWEMIHSVGRGLFVLPASVFAAPDYPVASKVSVETLIEFVTSLQHLARTQDCGWLVLECQGQLSNPMTFFSLKSADRVIIPLGKPTEAAYALICIRRLVQIYKHTPGQFILAVEGKPKAMEEVIFAKNSDELSLAGLQIVFRDGRKIKAMLDMENTETWRDRKRSNLSLADLPRQSLADPAGEVLDEQPIYL